MKQIIFTLLFVIAFQVSSAQTEVRSTSDIEKEAELERKAVIKKV